MTFTAMFVVSLPAYLGCWTGGGLASAASHKKLPFGITGTLANQPKMELGYNATWSLEFNQIYG